nr:hypothetical protein CFP56_12992 [Quercus suber]
MTADLSAALSDASKFRSILSLRVDRDVICDDAIERCLATDMRGIDLNRHPKIVSEDDFSFGETKASSDDRYDSRVQGERRKEDDDIHEEEATEQDLGSVSERYDIIEAEKGLHFHAGRLERSKQAGSDPLKAKEAQCCVDDCEGDGEESLSRDMLAEKLGNKPMQTDEVEGAVRATIKTRECYCRHGQEAAAAIRHVFGYESAASSFCQRVLTRVMYHAVIAISLLWYQWDLSRSTKSIAGSMLALTRYRSRWSDLHRRWSQTKSCMVTFVIITQTIPSVLSKGLKSSVAPCKPVRSDDRLFSETPTRTNHAVRVPGTLITVERSLIGMDIVLAVTKVLRTAHCRLAIIPHSTLGPYLFDMTLNMMDCALFISRTSFVSSLAGFSVDFTVFM